jgi:hypothetical protein
VNYIPEGQPVNQFSHQSRRNHAYGSQRGTTRSEGEEQLKELVICCLNSSVIVLQTMLSGHPAASLLDSGASGIFVTSQFISKFNISTSPVRTKAVRLADGKLLQVNQMISNVPSQFIKRQSTVILWC